MIEVYAQSGDEATVRFLHAVAYVTGLKKYVVYLGIYPSFQPILQTFYTTRHHY